MKCPKCQYKLTKSDIYCPGCGEQLDDNIKNQIKLDLKKESIICDIVIVICIAISIAAIVCYNLGSIPRSHDTQVSCNNKKLTCPEECNEAICTCIYINDSGEKTEVKCLNTNYKGGDN